jgi:hypothetical protein
VELNTQVAVGKEVQNSRTKPSLPGSAVEQSKRSANSLWAAVTGDRGRGPQWADGAGCEERAAGATVEAPAAVQGAARQRLGQWGGPWAMAHGRSTGVTPGHASPVACSKFQGRSQGSMFLSKYGVSMGLRSSVHGQTQKIALQLSSSRLATRE